MSHNYRNLNRQHTRARAHKHTHMHTHTPHTRTHTRAHTHTTYTHAHARAHTHTHTAFYGLVQLLWSLLSGMPVSNKLEHCWGLLMTGLHRTAPGQAASSYSHKQSRWSPENRPCTCSPPPGSSLGLSTTSKWHTLHKRGANA